MNRPDFALALLALAACGDAAAPAPAEDAEKKDAQMLVLTEADDAKTFILGVGDTFETKLESIPTAGYSWHVSHMPEGLEQLGEDGWAPTDPHTQSQPGFTGGNHYILKRFKTTAPGDYDLVLIEGRPWELFLEDGDLTPDWEDYVEGRFQVRLRVRAD